MENQTPITAPRQPYELSQRAMARRALRDDVYDAVLEKILEGSAPAGSSLRIEALARELEVSPTPVREALVQLEHTGLVSRVALKGYRIAPPMSAEELAEVFDMRMIVETAAAERAAQRAAEIVPELRVAHAEHVLAAHRVQELRENSTAPPEGYGDLRAYFSADWKFHLTILCAARNRFLVQTSESLNSHVQRMRQTIDHGQLDIRQAIDEHTAILHAFEAGEPAGIVAAVQAHLAAVSERVSDDG